MRVCLSQTSVVSVRERPDFAVTGQWEVETEGREAQRETHVFDAVIVCSGHFTQPHLPLTDFTGTLKTYLQLCLLTALKSLYMSSVCPIEVAMCIIFVITFHLRY